MQILNWKLQQLKGKYRVISTDFIAYRDRLFEKLSLPVDYNQPFFHRGETNIHWEKMPTHYSFFFDYEGNEGIVQMLKNTPLKNYDEIIVEYPQDDLIVAIDMTVFLEDWEEIFASTLYNSLFFTFDNKLIMEISRDYLLHSNFLINSKGSN